MFAYYSALSETFHHILKSLFNAFWLTKGAQVEICQWWLPSIWTFQSATLASQQAQHQDPEIGLPNLDTDELYSCFLNIYDILKMCAVKKVFSSQDSSVITLKLKDMYFFNAFFSVTCDSGLLKLIWKCSRKQGLQNHDNVQTNSGNVLKYSLLFRLLKCVLTK